MDYKLKQPLLWVLATLTIFAAVPNVHAATIGTGQLSTIFEPIINMFGPNGFAGIYTQQTAMFWDSLIVLLMFGWALSGILSKQKVFGENTGKIAWLFAVILAIGMSVFEYNTTFRLGTGLGVPSFILAFFFIVGYIIYALANRALNSPIKSFCLAYFFTFLMMPQSAAAAIGQYTPQLVPWLSILWGIAGIGVIVVLFNLIGKVTGEFSKATGGAFAFGSRVGGRGGHQIQALSSGLGNVAQAAQQVARNIQQPRTPPPVNTQAQQAVAAQLQQVQEGYTVLQTLKASIKSTNDFAQSVQEEVKKQTDAGNVVTDAYKQAINSRITDVQKRFTEYNEPILRALVSESIDAQREQAIQTTIQQVESRITDAGLHTLADDKKLFEQLAAQEKTVAGLFADTVSTLNNKELQQVRNTKTYANVQGLVDEFTAETPKFEAHKKRVAQLRDRYLALVQLANEVTADQDKMRTDLKAYGAAHEQSKPALTTLGSSLGMYQRAVVMSLGTLDFTEAKRLGDVVIKQVADIETLKQTQHTALTDISTQLTTVQEKRTQITEQFDAFNHELLVDLRESAKLSVLAISTQLALEQLLNASALEQAARSNPKQFGIDELHPNLASQKFMTPLDNQCKGILDELQSLRDQNKDPDFADIFNKAQAAILGTAKAIAEEYTQYVTSKAAQANAAGKKK